MIILREFQKTYSSDNAIWWWTRGTFLSQIFHKAWKLRNLDVIFLFRFFIHDLEQQLHQYQCLTAIKVYRYQLMAKKDLEVLKESIGQLISVNHFFLTNANRQSVLPIVNFAASEDGYQPVLFEITADFNLEKIKPFGDITSLKYTQNDQNEVLFMLGSIFQLKRIHQDDQQLWIIEMTLTSKSNESLKTTFDQFKSETFDDHEISLLSLGYILQKMNKLADTEKYYRRLFSELSDEDEHLGYCCLNLGNIAFRKGEYTASLEWLLKSLDLSIRTLNSEDEFFAQIYNSLGHVYHAQDDFVLALESYKKAIIIWKQTIDENYLNIAESMNNIGIIYKQEKDYLLALENFQKTFLILEKYLPVDHFELSKIHCNIASTHRQLEEYDLAVSRSTTSMQS